MNKKIISEETRRKISETLKRKGIKPRKIYCAYGKDNHFYGKKHSEESKVKISLAKLGKPNLKKRYNIFKDCRICNIEFRVAKWNEDQFLCSPICVGKWFSITRRGTNSQSYIDGRSREGQRLRTTVDYANWRMMVLKRDNFTCVLCGYKSRTSINGKSDIQADHIKQFAYYPELRLNIDNGRTLCIPCHKSTDTFNYRREINYANI